MSQNNMCHMFQQTGNCQYGEQCRFSHGQAAAPAAGRRDGGRKFQAAAGQAQERVESGDRLICYNWRDSGDCQYGDQCRYSHGEQPTAGSRRKGMEPCFTFRDTGSCRYGAECRYSHDPAALASAPPAREPRAPRPPRESAGAAGGADGGRRSVQVCYTFRDSGSCKFGDTCRFSHAAEQPAQF